MTKLDILNSLQLGSRVAEEERKTLNQYFWTSQTYGNLVADKLDIILGAKGMGKSALCFHLFF